MGADGVGPPPRLPESLSGPHGVLESRGTAAWLWGQGHGGARASSAGASAANDTFSERGARAALATHVLCTFVLAFKAP